ncbi:MAG: Fic family protein [Rhizobiaceae bacterium]
MDFREFIDSPSGTLIPTLSGQMAFLPHPLPPLINYERLVLPLAETMQALGELNSAGRALANPKLVIRPLQRREALLSSSMEGTYTTANALALAEADVDGMVDESTIEVRNYIRAFERAERMRQTLPISNRLIKETHETLLRQASSYRGASKRPGAYKDQQNFIGGKTRRIEDARFIPPPPNETEQAMAELEKYINRENSNGIPPIIDAALIHYQFETIHPFSDGNGRVGRILIPIYLIEKSVLDAPLLYLSPSVEGNKDRYVDLMLDVSKNGNWTDWILFFLEMTKNSCQGAIETIKSLEKLRIEFKDKLASSGSSARYLAIADDLFLTPVTSIPKVAETCKVTYPSAKAAVERFKELGILTEIETSSNPRLYISWPVVHLSEGNQ